MSDPRTHYLAAAPLRLLSLAEMSAAAARILVSPAREAVRCSADEVFSFASLVGDFAIVCQLATDARAGDRAAAATLFDHLARLGFTPSAAQPSQEQPAHG